MACLGVHFALTPEEAKTLLQLQSNQERLDYLQGTIEESYFSDFPEFKAESDKAWDAMHRALSDGELSFTTGPHPLRLVVIGGAPLYTETDYIMSLKTPAEVKEVATVIQNLGKEGFKKKYEEIDASKYGFPKSEQDFEYTWEWFTGVVALYQLAAAESRYVLFTADQ